MHVTALIVLPYCVQGRYLQCLYVSDAVIFPQLHSLWLPQRVQPHEMGASSDLGGCCHWDTRWIQVREPADAVRWDLAVNYEGVVRQFLFVVTSWWTLRGRQWASREESSAVTAWTAWTGPTSSRASWPDVPCSLSFRCVFNYCTNKVTKQ